MTSIYSKNDIFITQSSTNDQDLIFKTETIVSPYVSAILEVNLPKKIMVAEITISPDLNYNTNRINYNILVDSVTKISKNIQTKLQKSIIRSNNQICSIYITKPNTNRSYYIDNTNGTVRDTTNILSSEYWKSHLKSNVRMATFKNTPINQNIIHKKCPTCIPSNSPLLTYGDSKLSIGDMMLYSDDKPYLLQTLYVGLEKYIQYYSNAKYVLVLLTTSDFMLYELYVNFLGFIDLDVVLENTYQVLCIEYTRILSILKKMLVFLNH